MKEKYCYNRDGWCDEDNCRCYINYHDTPDERKRLGDDVVDAMNFILAPNKEQRYKDNFQKIEPKVWDENFPTRGNAVQDSGFMGIID